MYLAGSFVVALTRTFFELEVEVPIPYSPPIQKKFKIQKYQISGQFLKFEVWSLMSDVWVQEANNKLYI